MFTVAGLKQNGDFTAGHPFKTYPMSNQEFLMLMKRMRTTALMEADGYRQEKNYIKQYECNIKAALLDELVEEFKKVV